MNDMMKLIETEIKDCYIIETVKFHDDRGYFHVPFNRYDFYSKTGISFDFVQENESSSIKNTIRGLHFQTGEFEQTKLVRCTHGMVNDVIVDLREDSPSYGAVVTVNLTPENGLSVFVPKGCAHGFSAIKESIFHYVVDNHYNKQSEGGIRYDDPQLNIEWGIEGDPLISDKDLLLPNFNNIYKV
jgi:dTDP-4-dehydrorhamnose 3,5-epimerase